MIEICRVYANSVQTSSLTVLTSFLAICVQPWVAYFQLVIQAYISRTPNNWLCEQLFLFRFIHGRKFTGKYGYWRLVPIPAIVGGLLILFASDKVSSLFGHAASIVVSIYSDCLTQTTMSFVFLRTKVFDMLTRDGSVWPLKLLFRSNVFRTLLFMGLSGIIMDSLYMDTSSAFWLFHPTKTRVKSIKYPNEICQHENTCDIYATQVCEHQFSRNSIKMCLVKTFYFV